jgi:hypothetical protein
VQIGDNIARRKNTGPFTCHARNETVLYIDFELTNAQFYQRYNHTDGADAFSGNFYRAQFNPVADVPPNFETYDDFIIAGIEGKIALVKATVLIIDNISCLRGGTENAGVALRLMNNLKSLKTQYRLSILVLAHTPKRRNQTRPITPDDLHGSKLLINFADSAFAMGKSHADKSLRYVKQIKQRNTQQLYDQDNVCLCRIVKPRSFLKFAFAGYSAEQPHLLVTGKHGYNRATVNRAGLLKKIKDLSAAGLSQKKIAKELQVSAGTVNKMLRR